MIRLGEEDGEDTLQHETIGVKESDERQAQTTDVSGRHKQERTNRRYRQTTINAQTLP
jgi:hypothetical protein